MVWVSAFTRIRLSAESARCHRLKSGLLTLVSARGPGQISAAVCAPGGFLRQPPCTHGADTPYIGCTSNIKKPSIVRPDPAHSSPSPPASRQHPPR